MNSSVNTQREIIWQFFHPARKSKNIWLPLYWVGYSGILIANLVSIELFGHFLSLEPSLAGVWLEATNRRSRPTIYQWQDIHQKLTSTWRAACWKTVIPLLTLLDTLRLVLVDPQHGLQNKFHWNYSFAAPNSISKHLLHTSAAQSAKCSFPQ